MTENQTHTRKSKTANLYDRSVAGADQCLLHDITDIIVRANYCIGKSNNHHGTRWETPVLVG